MSNQTSPLSNIIAYPSNGAKKKGAAAGTWVFDFENGKVNLPDNTVEDMSASLNKLGKQFAKSFFIFVSTVDAEIRIGNYLLPKGQQTTWVINGISVDTLTIKLPNDRTPVNDFSLQVFASDATTFPIDMETIIANHNPDAKTGTSTDSYVTVCDFVFFGFNQLEIITENTHGSNGLTMNIQVSDDGTNWADYQGYPQNIAFGAKDVFGTSNAFRYYRLQVKSQTAGNAATYRVQPNLTR